MLQVKFGSTCSLVMSQAIAVKVKLLYADNPSLKIEKNIKTFTINISLICPELKWKKFVNRQNKPEKIYQNFFDRISVLQFIWIQNSHQFFPLLVEVFSANKKILSKFHFLKLPPFTNAFFFYSYIEAVLNLQKL